MKLTVGTCAFELDSDILDFFDGGVTGVDVNISRMSISLNLRFWAVAAVSFE